MANKRETVLNFGERLPMLLRVILSLTILSLFYPSLSHSEVGSPSEVVYYGGAGNESGYSITTGDGGVFVSGWSGFTDANSGDGLVLRYTNSLTLEWNATWPDLSGWDVFRGVGVSTEGVYVAGVSYNRTSDTMGDKEQKGIVVKFPLTGATGGGYDGAIWDKQTPSAPGAFSYGGGEGLNALVQTEESGQTYIYATGAAQSGWSNCGRLYLSKLGADGTIIWTVNDGSEQVGYSISFGSAITTLNGNIYVAGQNDGSGSATCGTTSSKPYMRKYDRDGNLLWSRMSSLSGAYYGIASFGGTIYAVGTTPWESPTSY